MLSTLLSLVAKIVIKLLPADLISYLLSAGYRSMTSRHPHIIENLPKDLLQSLKNKDSSSLVLNILINDIKKSSLSIVLKENISFCMLQKNSTHKADVTLSGNLKTFIDMLQGNLDGDSAFFNRILKVNGNTELIVWLRNNLEKADLNILKEVFFAIVFILTDLGKSTQKK